MITLNSDRGFVKVEDWQEIEELPGFTRNLNPKEHELKEIIGRYIFKEYISCGLSNCHTPHGKGYIVSTKSGPITNIGHNCGNNHFGIEFGELSKILEREIQIHNYRESIGSFLIMLDLHKEKVAKIRLGDQGADVLYKKSQLLLKKSSGCPDEVVSIISNLVRSRSSDLMRDRVATKEEVEDLEAIQGKKLPRPFYIEEKIGTLNGISFLFKENDLRDRLVIDLVEGFKSISNLDVDSASHSVLKSWSNWASEVDRKIEEGEKVVASGRELLKKENLLQLASLIKKEQRREVYSAFVKNNM